MVQNHRTNPPRQGRWERPDVDPFNPNTPYIVRDWPVQVHNVLTRKLESSLLTASLVRFFRSNLHEWDESDSWRCQRYLGAGGFGSAALWTKIGPDSTLLDEVAMKEDRRCAENHRYARHLPTEAYNQCVLNDRGTSNIVWLRGFKAIVRDTSQDPPAPIWGSPPSELWRFYLEYAPYGNLQTLALRYKAFRRYLPELFLWHLFNSLARAILAFEEAAAAAPNMPGSNVEPIFLHLDLKPQNIFLGYEGSRNQQTPVVGENGGLDGELVMYPTIKVGDYGLSDFLLRDVRKRAESIGAVGTVNYQAPELFRSATPSSYLYGELWPHPPNSRTDLATHKVNVWNVGKVMYDLFSLSEPEHYERIEAETEDVYVRNGRNPIPNYISKPFERDAIVQLSPYSLELSQLIERCMYVEPARRLTAQELYDETRKNLQLRDQLPEPLDPCAVGRRKLYYRGQEINDMPANEANCELPLNPHDYFKLLGPAENDPDEPKLRLTDDRMFPATMDAQNRDALLRHMNLEYTRIRKKGKFARALHRNTRRVGTTDDGDIKFLDPDAELTYEGVVDDQYLIDEQAALAAGIFAWGGPGTVAVGAGQHATHQPPMPIPLQNPVQFQAQTQPQGQAASTAGQAQATNQPPPPPPGQRRARRQRQIRPGLRQNLRAAAPRAAKNAPKQCLVPGSSEAGESESSPSSKKRDRAGAGKNAGSLSPAKKRRVGGSV